MDTNNPGGKIECPSCHGDKRLDVSGPGPSYFGARDGWLTCDKCAGEGTVYVCPGCETTFTADSRDAESIERRGQCEWCIAYDAKHGEAA